MLENFMLEAILNRRAEGRTMTLTGQGRITLVPDIAVIRLGVELSGEDLAAIQSENAALSQAVLDSLRQLGIEDIRTYQHNIDRTYEYEDGTPVDLGYTVRNIFEIRMGEPALAGTVIDAAVAAGANVTELVSFELSDPEYHYQQALNLAVADTIKKAASISDELQVYVDPVPNSITENSSIPGPAQLFGREYAATPAVPGYVTIEAAVTAEFVY
jgi:uncharacterized protein YggE